MEKFVAATALSITMLASAVPALAAFDDLEKSWESFYSTGLETSRGISVENLTLQKDAMTLVLKKGILVPMQPIEGEITGAMFVGEGTATLVPPTPMDTWFLKKYYGADKFSENFTALYMRFSDGTDKALPQPALGTSSATVASGMKDISREFGDRQGVADGWESDRFDMDLDFMDTRIGGIRGQDYFYCQLETSKWGWVTFMVNHGEILEVSLGHDRTVGAYRQFLPWAEFHRKEDYQQGRYVMLPSSDNKEILDILNTQMHISIPTTKTVEIDAKVTLTPLVDSLGCLRFDLINQYGDISWRSKGRPVTVDSVTDAEGKPLPFIHKRNQILIRPPKPILKGENFLFQLKGKEDTIIQASAESYLLFNTYPWFPQYSFPYGRIGFDFTIEVQRPLVPVGSGEIVRQWEDKTTHMNSVELKIADQVQFPSFLFGRFLQEKDTYTDEATKSNVALSVYAFPTQTYTITDPNVLASLGLKTPVQGTLVIPQSKMKSILGEAKNILSFYEKLYGPFPYKSLQIAQMYPGSGFGQAPPALVQLDGLAFASQAELESDFIHSFLSHEIAHQWWGNCAGDANERDVWLAESFAEYSAGLYVQALQGDNRFKQMRTGWKKNARQADPMAPIALATLLSGDNAGIYYTQLVYNKGPLVVHMIRTQMGNENYVKAMSGLMSKYRNQNITTELLSKELGLVTNYNWDYFFDQWFRGVGIPEIHYKYNVTPAEGKYKFDITFTQKDKENFKRILALPVVWNGKGKDQMAQKTFVIKDPVQTYSLMLPFEPKSVEVDPNADLLADYVQDK